MKITHLMELEIKKADVYGRNGYRCALCDLGVVAANLREARKVADETYGKCPCVADQATENSVP